MKNRVMLLSIALVLGFLVGCGSDSSDKEDTISLGLFNDRFPAFNTDANISYVETDKRYRVSTHDVNSFRANVLLPYLYDGTRYYKNNILANVNSAAVVGGNDINLTLSSSNGTALATISDDDTYESLFGPIGGYVGQAHIHKVYLEDISLQYATYVAQLRSWGFTCAYRDCNNKVGDIHYRWYAYSDRAYVFSAFL